MRLILLLCMLGMSAFSIAGGSSDQLGLRVTQNGMNAILMQAKKYNTQGKITQLVSIPQKVYTFVIPKERLAKNTMVTLLNQISDVSLDKDLKFFLDSKKIDISGEVDAKYLNFEIQNQTADGFDLKLHTSVPTLKITSTKLTLCDELLKAKCGGLQASFINPSVSLLKGVPLKIAATLHISFKGENIQATVKEITTNLNNQNNPPKIAIDMTDLVVPEVKISINGQEATLDTSSLKEEILKRQEFLAQKLIGFAADFLSQDLVEMINKYLINETLPRDIDIFNYGQVKSLVDLDQKYVISNPADATYVYVPQVLQYPVSYGQTIQPKESDLDRIIKEIKMIIYYAKITLHPGVLSAPEGKNLELKASSSILLNRIAMSVGNTLRNSATDLLPDLNMNRTEYANDHFQMYISEPVLNGMLDVINKTGLYNFLLDKEAGDDAAGFSISSVKVHFKKTQGLADKLYVVANAKIDLRKTGYNTTWEWLKREIGVLLESSNNNAIIYFPLEFEVTPKIEKLTNGKVQLKLHVGSPFGSSASLPNFQTQTPAAVPGPKPYYQIQPMARDNTNVVINYSIGSFEPLKNSFSYPSNVKNMTNTVRNVVLDRLSNSFAKFTNKDFVLDIESLLNQKGVVFEVKDLKFIDSAYFMISANVKDIDFKVLSNRGDK